MLYDVRVQIPGRPSCENTITTQAESDDPIALCVRHAEAFAGEGEKLEWLPDRVSKGVLGGVTFTHCFWRGRCIVVACKPAGSPLDSYDARLAWGELTEQEQRDSARSLSSGMIKWAKETLDHPREDGA